MNVLGQRAHGRLQRAVDAVTHVDLGIAALDVDVAGPPLQRSEDDGIEQLDDGARAIFLREFLHGNIFVGGFLVANHLQCEAFGGMVKDALGLFGVLQQRSPILRGGRHVASLQAFAQVQREFVGELELRGIGDGDGQRATMRLQGHKIVAKQQFRGNAADQFRIERLQAKIHEWAAIAHGKLPGAFHFRGAICRPTIDELISAVPIERTQTSQPDIFVAILSVGEFNNDARGTKINVPFETGGREEWKNTARLALGEGLVSRWNWGSNRSERVLNRTVPEGWPRLGSQE